MVHYGGQDMVRPKRPSQPEVEEYACGAHPFTHTTVVGGTRDTDFYL